MTISLLLKALLLAAIITVSSAWDQGSTAGECPHVEVLRRRDGRDGRDGAKGERGDCVHSGEKGEPGEPGEKGDKGIHGMQGLLGFQVPVDQLVRKAYVETPACKDLKENRESRVHHQEESPTLAGVGQPAPLARELSWCMQAELGEHIGITKEEQPTISVCLIILTTCNIRVEYKVQVM